jgi:hypothetical protein
MAREEKALATDDTSGTDEPMIPVTQTMVGTAGNCLAASVASVLELPLSSVPDLRGERWLPKLNSWTRSFGWCPGVFKILPSNILSPCVALGNGPRGRPHAVVWVGGQRGRIVHDPHPSRAGLAGRPFAFVLLAPC